MKGCDELSAGILVHITVFLLLTVWRRMDEWRLWKMSAVKELPLQLESHPSASIWGPINAALLFKRILSRWICCGGRRVWRLVLLRDFQTSVHKHLWLLAQLKWRSSQTRVVNLSVWQAFGKEYSKVSFFPLTVSQTVKILWESLRSGGPVN